MSKALEHARAGAQALAQARAQAGAGGADGKPFVSTLPPEPVADVEGARKTVDGFIAAAAFDKNAAFPANVRKDGKLRKVNVSSVSPIVPGLFVARDGVLLQYNAARELIPVGDAAQIAEAAARDLAEQRTHLARKRHDLHKQIDEVARYAHSLGIGYYVVVPNDSTSRYVYLERDGVKLKIRAADHAQPYAYDPAKREFGVVGGYDTEAGKRHEASDLSLDPETGYTVEDAKRLIDKTYGANPVLDAVTGLARVKVATSLAQKAAQYRDGGSLSVLERLKLAADIRGLLAELGAGAAAADDHPAIATLRKIASGAEDGKGLAELYGLMQEAVGELMDANAMTDAAERAAHDAITQWAKLEEKEHAAA